MGGGLMAPATKTNGRPATPTNGEGAAEHIAPVPFEHEELAVRRGERSGAYVIVAIHSTALGPALGGARMWHYPSPIDASRDALRLAQGMTLKAAAAGLDLGGGKGVICAPDGGFASRDERIGALLDFADLVESLGGHYVTAEDVGTSTDDMVVLRERTQHVAGLPRDRGGSGDPSPYTAIGVEASIRATLQARYGSPELEGRTVAIVGLGHVGAQLAQRLAAAGAVLTVSDVDGSKQAIARELEARWVPASDAMAAECEVLSPCALGGAIDRSNVGSLRCRIVCGSANNQLADDSLAEELAAAGILYAPDFIANAGGLINVYREIRGYGPGRALELVLGIEGTMGSILVAAEARRTTPLVAARELAAERLAAAAEARRGAKALAVAH
jgi:leucine dehydrogenase